jgi:hypothetical protein
MEVKTNYSHLEKVSLDPPSSLDLLWFSQRFHSILHPPSFFISLENLIEHAMSRFYIPHIKYII